MALMDDARDREAAQQHQIGEVTSRAIGLVLDYLEDVSPGQRALVEHMVQAAACDCVMHLSGYVGADAAMLAARCLQLIR